MEKASGFNKEDYGLVSYRAEERLGFAFICLSNITMVTITMVTIALVLMTI